MLTKPWIGHGLQSFACYSGKRARNLANTKKTKRIRDVETGVNLRYESGVASGFFWRVLTKAMRIATSQEGSRRRWKCFQKKDTTAKHNDRLRHGHIERRYFVGVPQTSTCCRDSSRIRSKARAWPIQSKESSGSTELHIDAGPQFWKKANRRQRPMRTSVFQIWRIFQSRTRRILFRTGHDERRARNEPVFIDTT